MELAQGGTLFLSEVDDLSLELQAKLLHVLEHRKFQRVGGKRPLRADVRLVVATNRDLSKCVADGRFRSDLFYRLNVFSVCMPPLRERRKDIPLLARYFLQKFAARAGKTIDTIGPVTMDALVRWDWPGNVRELEEFIERAVLLSHGPVLHAHIGDLIPPCAGGVIVDSTLAAAERECVVSALREAQGTLSGPLGAAARLGLKRTVLQSKIHKFKIDVHDYR